MWDRLAPGALVQPCPVEREGPLSPDRRRRRRRLECEPLRRRRLCLDLDPLRLLRLRLAFLASFGGGVSVALLSAPLAVVSGKEEEDDSELAMLAWVGGAALFPASMTIGVAACAAPSPEEEEEESSAGSCALGAA